MMASTVVDTCGLYLFPFHIIFTLDGTKPETYLGLYYMKKLVAEQEHPGATCTAKVSKLPVKIFDIGNRNLKL